MSSWSRQAKNVKKWNFITNPQFHFHKSSTSPSWFRQRNEFSRCPPSVAAMARAAQTQMLESPWFVVTAWLSKAAILHFKVWYFLHNVRLSSAFVVGRGTEAFSLHLLIVHVENSFQIVSPLQQSNSQHWASLISCVQWENNHVTSA